MFLVNHLFAIKFFLPSTSLLLLVSLGCSQPIQLPGPMAVSTLYERLKSEKELNPTRFENFVESKPFLAFFGTIWRIDGKSIQFLIQERTMDKDSYVECKFPNEDYVNRFNVGQLTTVYGRLDDAFGTEFLGLLGESKAVKLKDCGPYPSAN